MQFFKKAVVGIFALSMSVSAFAISGSVGHAILEGLSQEGKEALAKIGLKETAQAELMRSLELAATGLNKGAKPATEDALRKLFSGNEEIIKILSQDFSKITDRDLAKLNNTLAESANRLKTGSAFIACTGCIDPELQKIGITVLAREASASSGKILAEAPTGAALQKALVSQARELKMPGATSEAIAHLSSTEQSQLFVALKKTSSGNPAEKALGKSIQKFSTQNGDSILNTKLWALMGEDLSEQDMQRMTTLLNKISSEEPSSSAKRIENLKQWFEANADSPELKEALENLKKKNCWGIF